MIDKLKEFNVKKNGRSRRLTIELHKSPSSTLNAVTDSTLQGGEGQQQCTERYYLRTTKKLLFSAIRKVKGDDASVAMDPFSSGQSVADQLSPIHESPTTSPARSAHTHATSTSGIGGGGEKWITRSLVDLKDANIVQVSGKKITIHLKGGRLSGYEEDEDSVNSMTIGGGGQNGGRQFTFKDVAQAQEFETALLHYKRKEQEVQTTQMDQISNGDSREGQNRSQIPEHVNGDLGEDRDIAETSPLVNPGNMNMDIDMDKIGNEQIKFLIEIVGCEDLPIADISTSDPYVVAKFNGKILHKTKHVSKSLNPIFTLRKLSLFTWEISARELFLQDQGGAGGLQLLVYDFDTLGANDLLGRTFIPAKDLYQAKEERLTYRLENPKPGQDGKKKNGIARTLQMPLQEKKHGTISIRCRRATDYDEEFMKTFTEHSKKKDVTGILRKKEEKGTGKFGWKKRKKRGEVGVSGIQSMLEKKVHTFYDVDGSKIQKMKVMPGPDPNDSLDTEWMTEEEIEKAVLDPSRQYTYVGCGKIARVYLEM